MFARFQGWKSGTHTIEDLCLEAPSPMRHLKENDRLRELEWENLGLMNKEKEHALERDKRKRMLLRKKRRKQVVYHLEL